MSDERPQPRTRFGITQAYLELATPVEGELRREPPRAAADADVACPRCGARGQLLIERRAESDQPLTRWRALACADCGAADGWESAGRTRRGRTAERWGESDQDEAVPGMPDEPTVADVCRLAPFRVLSPGPSARLRRYSYIAGRLTGVTLAYERVEVTTEVSSQAQFSLPPGHEPQDRARSRLAQQFVDSWLAARTASGSEPGSTLNVAAPWRQAQARAATAPARNTMIEVDGAPVPFTLVAEEEWWAAAAGVADTSVTIAARDVPIATVALETVVID